MQYSLSKKRIRKNFGKINLVSSIPNLIEVQKQSYNKEFLQLDIPINCRENKGLQGVLNSIFPIYDLDENAILEFVKYDFDEPKYDVEECVQRGISYTAALKITLSLIIFDDSDSKIESKEIKGIKEQVVYFGDIPLMTTNGTFIINGTERVVVSQMHRSPGVFFDHDEGKTHSTGKLIYSARVIPYRGSWLDFEFDAKDLLYFRIDRKRKLYVTTLLRALGMSLHDILDFYYESVVYKKSQNMWIVDFLPELVSTKYLVYNLTDAQTGKVVLNAGQKITFRIAKMLFEKGVKQIVVNNDSLVGKLLAEDLVNNQTGEVLLGAGEEITNEVLTVVNDLQITTVKVLAIGPQCGPYIRNTLFVDKNKDQKSSLIEIFKVLKPGEIATVSASRGLFDSLFFDLNRYDLSEVGRIKINSRLNLDIDLKNTCITVEDIKSIIKLLINIKDGKASVDDIDHLGNRRVRSVGELVENQFRIGLIRIAKFIVERMGNVEIDTVIPNDLVNAKLLTSVIKEFFGTSQLSQFMDQTNALSQITHIRRLSALGPGGLNRDRAALEVRDVHPTHYGRICPIETPEGQNVGLINSLAIFAKINKYGFIESPYRRVINRKITDEVVYLSALEEGKYKIAQADTSLYTNNCIVDELVSCRYEGNFVIVPAQEVDFIDLTPMQVVSVAASMIPFLENDDANRALMGANMQRQAVPLLRSEAPFVGTGIESIVACDSGTVIVALHDGIVEQVESTRVVVKTLMKNDIVTPGVDIYNLKKFQRSNYNTCINQKVLVNVGDIVKKGDVIADGVATNKGEIALGSNVLVAFIAWNGYNFEDSILVSERIVKEDIYTSIHIEELELVARDTRLGPEEITRDIPNVSEENLHHLDEVGIVNIGAQVRTGDVLVGKVTPKNESPITPEEKLLRAIFGEKASEVKDSSLYVPPGITGTIIDVRIFSRRGIDKDQRALAIEKQKIRKLVKDYEDELAVIKRFAIIRVKELLIGQICADTLDNILIGDKLDEAMLSNLTDEQLFQLKIASSGIMTEISEIKKHYKTTCTQLTNQLNSKIEKIQGGDDLPQGVLKIVKVFIAIKHRLQPGDKMAGRHGNKGVVSKVVPEEDMPFLEDGTIIDIVLNPLGLPGRMNVGQILETHLGWAGVNLGYKIGKMVDNYYSSNSQCTDQIRDFIKKIYTNSDIANTIDKVNDQQLMEICQELRQGIYFSTPVFDGAKIADIKQMLELADVDRSGQVKLIDGRTGEYFDRRCTVGYQYLLKLHHLVDEKIHARSIGPYSLVTQQPLGGKSHFGGQRFGEMECWALEAYGAAYILQELLTTKSDSVEGRIKMYQAIIRGDNNFVSGVPESLNVMIKELRSLCLNIQLEEKENDEDENY
ncbi:DNA-directed RNA polymerase, beta subunit [Orientia chuto str. Dubai]|uniref:DNA-directed RNA polymerase subunit beta n=1 Tax=Orientia chuto str. Dubai TaxID=1359168 RepID=A0A0F3MP30_9RICK|nr:DNA-directed RNA polymerase subunit beta [Candidatus Orientia mediorientalis]KJV57500.1 DNA-directed RNA polymerase, beta subunit [Orientia chuto str. Dubai]